MMARCILFLIMVMTLTNCAQSRRITSDHAAPDLVQAEAEPSEQVILADGTTALDNQNDPFEPANRSILNFNQTLDDVILEPVARVYRGVTPRVARQGISNLLSNFRTPVVLANDLFQAEPERAVETLGRFMLNTILGLGGLIDVGTKLGMPERHDEDFGQTLAVYGVGDGPYLMVPLLGPSNPRDLAGRVVDLVFDPLSLLAPLGASLGRTGTAAVSEREANIETVEEFERTSIDLYAALRSVSRQHRANEIRNGDPASLYDFPELYDLE